MNDFYETFHIFCRNTPKDDDGVENHNQDNKEEKKLPSYETFRLAPQASMLSAPCAPAWPSSGSSRICSLRRTRSATCWKARGEGS
jgi:hypothetical protein